MRVAALKPVGSFLERLGAPVEGLLRRVNLWTGVLSDEEALIPVRQAVRFFEESARTQGIENLGLLAAQETPLEVLGVFGRLIRRALTLHDAVETLLRMGPIFSSGARSWIVREGDRLRWCHKFVAGLDGGYRQVDQHSLMLRLRLLQLAAGPSWRPAEVGLETGRSGGFDDTELLAGVRTAFAQPVTSVTFPRSLLSSPLGQVDVGEEVHADDIRAWMASAPKRDFPGSVRQAVETLSCLGYPPIGLAADAIGMSVRTLQRRLADAGVGYERLIRRECFAEAVRLLEDTDAKVVDIALDLGYSDHAHFTRAFRRWAGISPREFRRTSRRSGDVSTGVRA